MSRDRPASASTDGAVMRVSYAGRNGRPYTSIGRLLVQSGVMDLETMTLERLMGWLREHPDEARALMRQQRSYIFFREAAELGPERRTHRRGRHSPRPGPEPRGRPDPLVLRPAHLARGPAAGLPRQDRSP